MKTADFTLSSDFGPILIVSQEDDQIVVFEPNVLIKLMSFNAGNGVSVLNCELGKHLIIGYANG